MHFALDKKRPYLLACSFGPDSMALLNMLVSEGFKPIVCHVNYHRRPESNLEQSGLEQYCLEHDLTLDVLDTTGMKVSGNFQAWARNVRYRFFQKLYHEYSAEGLLVAHQQDDHLETYLMQKARKTRLISYGLSQKTKLYDMNVLRPLLHLSKASLKEYCEQNKVLYAIDSSNLTDHYQRNRVRHAIVEKMSPETRLEMLSEIDSINKKNATEVLTLEKGLLRDGSFPVNQARNLSDDAFTFLLYLMLQKQQCSFPLSFDRINQIRKMCESAHPNNQIVLGRTWVFERRYDTLLLTRVSTPSPYAYEIPSPQAFKCPYFSVDFSEGYLKNHIPLESYPLTLRPSKSGDRIPVGKMVKRINRLFIDWKLPMTLRAIWPVVVDKNGTPIYIPRFQKDHRLPPQSNFQINECFYYDE